MGSLKLRLMRSLRTIQYLLGECGRFSSNMFTNDVCPGPNLGATRNERDCKMNCFAETDGKRLTGGKCWNER